MWSPWPEGPGLLRVGGQHQGGWGLSLDSAVPSSSSRAPAEPHGSTVLSPVPEPGRQARGLSSDRLWLGLQEGTGSRQPGHPRTASSPHRWALVAPGLRHSCQGLPRPAAACARRGWEAVWPKPLQDRCLRGPGRRGLGRCPGSQLPGGTGLQSRRALPAVHQTMFQIPGEAGGPTMAVCTHLPLHAGQGGAWCPPPCRGPDWCPWCPGGLGWKARGPEPTPHTASPPGGWRHLDLGSPRSGLPVFPTIPSLSLGGREG